MVDVKKLLRRIAPEEVELGDTATIAGEGSIEQFGDRERLVITVQFNDAERELVLNQPSLRRICRAWGHDTKAWLGRKLKAIEKRETMIEARRVIYWIWTPVLEESKFPNVVECPKCGVDNPVDNVLCWRCKAQLRV